MTGLARGGVAGVGLELAASPASAAKPLSVVVAGVVEGSPAEKAGVLTGDELSAVDGEEARKVATVAAVVTVRPLLEVAVVVIVIMSRSCHPFLSTLWYVGLKIVLPR